MVLTLSVLSPRDLEELLDVGDLGRHVGGVESSVWDVESGSRCRSCACGRAKWKVRRSHVASLRQDFALGRCGFSPTSGVRAVMQSGQRLWRPGLRDMARQQ